MAAAAAITISPLSIIRAPTASSSQTMTDIGHGCSHLATLKSTPLNIPVHFTITAPSQPDLAHFNPTYTIRAKDFVERYRALVKSSLACTAKSLLSTHAGTNLQQPINKTSILESENSPKVSSSAQMPPLKNKRKKNSSFENEIMALEEVIIIHDHNLFNISISATFLNVSLQSVVTHLVVFMAVFIVHMLVAGLKITSKVIWKRKITVLVNLLFISDNYNTPQSNGHDSLYCILLAV
jgi:hypothetical protein